MVHACITMNGYNLMISCLTVKMIYIKIWHVEVFFYKRTPQYTEWFYIYIYRAAYKNLGWRGGGGKLKLLNIFRGFMPRLFLSYQQETILNIWNRNPCRIP